MSQINSTAFAEFFKAVNGFTPYDWQQRLVDMMVEGRWPDAIDLPTGAGKTACLEAAVFALACEANRDPAKRSVPVRIFFCVNRRVIVDEAYNRAKRLATKLLDAERNSDPAILGKVVTALRMVSGTSIANGTPPLDVLPLRGGTYRDDRWARSTIQPTIVTATVDQLGSRLLFRGYGVSTASAPIQAALVAFDSLILLDEAHISRPFLDTLDAVRGYLDPERWAEKSIGVAPMRVIPMTATPPGEVNDVLRLSDADRNALGNRLQAEKPAKLVAVKDVGKEAVELAREVVRQQLQAVGIIVNRVATAKEIHAALLQKAKNGKKSAIPADTPIELVIGSMRPVDRDKQSKRLKSRVGPERPEVTGQPSIVVATQCLEVGADYDFDVLITECASLDALRQRFGRLNRGGRSIEASAYVLIDEKQAKPNDKLNDDKPDDPIYDNALARTWNWLNQQRDQENGAIDFGIDALDAILASDGEKPVIPPELRSPSSHKRAPVMLPIYVDFWRQTAPAPSPDPDVSLFLHGEPEGARDLRVCWRTELDHFEKEHWAEVVAPLPPTSPECMSVPIGRFKRWITDGKAEKKLEDDDSDLLEVADGSTAEFQKYRLQKDALLWRGSHSDSTKRLHRLSDLRPGDTVVLPVSAKGWDLLGHIPAGDENSRIIDCAEQAYAQAKDKLILRFFTGETDNEAPEGQAAIASLLEAARKHVSKKPLSKPEWRELITDAANAADSATMSNELSILALAFRIELYPDNKGVVLRGFKRLGRQQLMLPDDNDELSSFADQNVEVLLEDHSSHVAETVSDTIQRLPLEGFIDIYEVVAELHDLGKADERFQAMLRQEDRTDAWLFAGSTETNAFLAKSGGTPLTRKQFNDACRRAELPKGFRHEMLSLQIAERHRLLPTDPENRDLVLHLNSSHHGLAAPFAPVVIDDDPPPLVVGGVELTADDRTAVPPHRLNSGVADRFWRLVRRYGWWGLAYLETVFRLADWQASAAEQAGAYGDAEQTLEETNV